MSAHEEAEKLLDNNDHVVFISDIINVKNVNDVFFVGKRLTRNFKEVSAMDVLRNEHENDNHSDNYDELGDLEIEYGFENVCIHISNYNPFIGLCLFIDRRELPIEFNDSIEDHLNPNTDVLHPHADVMKKYVEETFIKPIHTDLERFFEQSSKNPQKYPTHFNVEYASLPKSTDPTQNMIDSTSFTAPETHHGFFINIVVPDIFKKKNVVRYFQTIAKNIEVVGSEGLPMKKYTPFISSQFENSFIKMTEANTDSISQIFRKTKTSVNSWVTINNADIAARPTKMKVSSKYPDSRVIYIDANKNYGLHPIEVQYVIPPERIQNFDIEAEGLEAFGKPTTYANFVFAWFEVVSSLPNNTTPNNIMLRDAVRKQIDESWGTKCVSEREELRRAANVAIKIIIYRNIRHLKINDLLEPFFKNIVIVSVLDRLPLLSTEEVVKFNCETLDSLVLQTLVTKNKLGKTVDEHKMKHHFSEEVVISSKLFEGKELAAYFYPDTENKESNKYNLPLMCVLFTYVAPTLGCRLTAIGYFEQMYGGSFTSYSEHRKSFSWYKDGIYPTPIENIEMKIYGTELEAIKAYVEDMNITDPDVITGHNTSGYDWKHIYHRLVTYDQENILINGVGRLNVEQYHADLKMKFQDDIAENKGFWKNNMNFKQYGLMWVNEIKSEGNNKMLTIDPPFFGRIHLDFMVYMKRNVKMDNMQLNYIVSEIITDKVTNLVRESPECIRITTKNTSGIHPSYFLIFYTRSLSKVRSDITAHKYRIREIQGKDIILELPRGIEEETFTDLQDYVDRKIKFDWGLAKDDMSYSELMRCTWSQNPDDRARMLQYCIHDCEVMARAITKQEIIAGCKALGRMTQCSISDILTGGQGKWLNNIYVLYSIRNNQIVCDKFGSQRDFEEKSKYALGLEDVKINNKEAEILTVKEAAYKGAIVLPPQIGAEFITGDDDPVGTAAGYSHAGLTEEDMVQLMANDDHVDDVGLQEEDNRFETVNQFVKYTQIFNQVGDNTVCAINDPSVEVGYREIPADKFASFIIKFPHYLDDVDIEDDVCILDNPTAVTDFNSLYPSIIVGCNLDQNSHFGTDLLFVNKTPIVEKADIQIKNHVRGKRVNRHGLSVASNVSTDKYICIHSDRSASAYYYDNFSSNEFHPKEFTPFATHDKHYLICAQDIEVNALKVKWVQFDPTKAHMFVPDLFTTDTNIKLGGSIKYGVLKKDVVESNECQIQSRIQETYVDDEFDVETGLRILVEPKKETSIKKGNTTIKFDSPKFKIRQVQVDIIRRLYWVQPYMFYHWKQHLDGPILNLIKSLLNERKQLKKEGKNEKDDFRKAVIKAREMAVKTSTNSVYGQLGRPLAMLAKREVAMTVTANGRNSIVLIRDVVTDFFPGKQIIMYCGATINNHPKLKKKFINPPIIHVDNSDDLDTVDGRERLVEIFRKQIIDRYDAVKQVYKYSKKRYKGMFFLSNMNIVQNFFMDLDSARKKRENNGDDVSCTNNKSFDIPLNFPINKRGDVIVKVYGEEKDEKTKIVTKWGIEREFGVAGEPILFAKVRRGRSMYGDTDSVFMRFVHEIRTMFGRRIVKRLTQKYATIYTARLVEVIVSAFIFRGMNLEYEKSFSNFISFEKKQYVGDKYEGDPDDFKFSMSGMRFTRRGFSIFGKESCEDLLQSVFKKDHSLLKMYEYLVDLKKSMDMDNDYEYDDRGNGDRSGSKRVLLSEYRKRFDKFSVTKSVNRCVDPKIIGSKITEDVQKVEQWALAFREANKNPDRTKKIGEKITYVHATPPECTTFDEIAGIDPIVNKDGKALAVAKIETVEAIIDYNISDDKTGESTLDVDGYVTIRNNPISIDVSHYMEKEVIPLAIMLFRVHGSEKVFAFVDDELKNKANNAQLKQNIIKAKDMLRDPDIVEDVDFCSNITDKYKEMLDKYIKTVILGEFIKEVMDKKGTKHHADKNVRRMDAYIKVGKGNTIVSSSTSLENIKPIDMTNSTKKFSSKRERIDAMFEMSENIEKSVDWETMRRKPDNIEGDNSNDNMNDSQSTKKPRIDSSPSSSSLSILNLMLNNDACMDDFLHGNGSVLRNDIDLPEDAFTRPIVYKEDLPPKVKKEKPGKPTKSSKSVKIAVKSSNSTKVMNGNIMSFFK